MVHGLARRAHVQDDAPASVYTRKLSLAGPLPFRSADHFQPLLFSIFYVPIPKAIDRRCGTERGYGLA